LQNHIFELLSLHGLSSAESWQFCKPCGLQ
jgi:hypothetical protein